MTARKRPRKLMTVTGFQERQEARREVPPRPPHRHPALDLLSSAAQEMWDLDVDARRRAASSWRRSRRAFPRSRSWAGLGDTPGFDAEGALEAVTRARIAAIRCCADPCVFLLAPGTAHRTRDAPGGGQPGSPARLELPTARRRRPRQARQPRAGYSSSMYWRKHARRREPPDRARDRTPHQADPARPGVRPRPVVVERNDFLLQDPVHVHGVGAILGRLGRGSSRARRWPSRCLRCSPRPTIHRGREVTAPFTAAFIPAGPRGLEAGPAARFVSQSARRPRRRTRKLATRMS